MGILAELLQPVSGSQVKVRSCTGYCLILRNSPYHTAQTEGYLLTQIAKEYAGIESQLRLIDWIKAQKEYQITNPKCPGCTGYSEAEKAKLIGLAQSEISGAQKRIGDLTLTLNKLREQYQGSAIEDLGASHLVPDENFQRGLIFGGLREELRRNLQKLFPKMVKKPDTASENTSSMKVLIDGQTSPEQETVSTAQNVTIDRAGQENKSTWVIVGIVALAFLAIAALKG